MRCNTIHINQSSFSVKPQKKHQDLCRGIRTHAGGYSSKRSITANGGGEIGSTWYITAYASSRPSVHFAKAKLTPANKLAFAIVDLDAFAFGQIRRFLFTFMPLRFGACRYAMYMKKTLFCQPAWIMYFGRLAMLCSSLMHMPTPHSQITPPWEQSSSTA